MKPASWRQAAALIVAIATAAHAGMARAASAVPAQGYAAVVGGRPLQFPVDHGSHPAFRTEWWYVTGWLDTGGGESLGFQITFFRTKPPIDASNPSAFAPRQILIAHAALSDPKRGRLWQDQRIRRVGFGLAEAGETDTDVHIDDWALKRSGDVYHAHASGDFGMDLELRATQPPMVNGDGGVSRKGPVADAASYYYSLPHLAVSGSIRRGSTVTAVQGEAWLDHEWSSQYLDAEAVGWDWIGINLDGGAALMAFRIRDPAGGARWAGGTYRAGDGRMEVLGPDRIEFDAVRFWESPRTTIRYPVEWRINAGGHRFTLAPLMDDQENDTRLTTGAIYWEGAVRALDPLDRRVLGRGYLELTGYGSRLELR